MEPQLGLAVEAVVSPLDRPCCDSHNAHCEPPGELCCHACTEVAHPEHPPGVACVLDFYRVMSGVERLLPPVKLAIRWLNNGMVMAFDSNGEQIPELQGRYAKRRDEVLAAADAGTTFEHGVFREWLRPVRREDW